MLTLWERWEGYNRLEEGGGDGVSGRGGLCGREVEIGR
jgi:hypothetical protein